MSYLTVKDPISGRDTDLYAALFDGYQILVLSFHVMVILMIYNHTYLVALGFLVSFAVTPLIIIANDNT